ncbi:MAG: hypothetical protein V7704_11145, partial [Aurantimonas endophytica]|uniref:hypothetical protein n=1 Tax=Aurantimonas endophytica TaxID=1522175 RepID=UPI00300173ED
LRDGMIGRSGEFYCGTSGENSRGIDKGHDEAVVEMRKRKRRARDIAFILSQIPKLPQVLGAARDALPIAQDLDAVEAALKGRRESTLRMRAWQTLGAGELRVRESLTESFQRADGSTGERQIESMRIYARIGGAAILNPLNRPLAPVISKAIERLAEVATDFSDVDLGKLEDTERSRVAKLVEREQGKLRETLEKMGERQAFLSPITINTLRTWGEMPNAEMRCFFVRDGETLYVGRDQNGKIRVPVGRNVDLSIPRLPSRA